MRTLTIAIILAAAALPASLPEGAGHWTAAQLRGYEKTLAPKINAQKVSLENLANYGNHSLLMAHRQGDGEAELHETQNDVTIIESGEATMVLGGSLVNARSTAPHEMRAASIKDGQKIHLGPGDIVHVPVKTPHQMLVPAGKQVTYFVVKIDAR